MKNKEKDYTLYARSRRGHFNWANPSEEEISMRLSCAGRIVNVSHKDTLIIPMRNGYINPIEAWQILEGWIDALLYSTQFDEVKEFINFLKSNKEKIQEANRKAIIAKKKKEIEKLKLEIVELLEK